MRLENSKTLKLDPEDLTTALELLRIDLWKLKANIYDAKIMRYIISYLPYAYKMKAENLRYKIDDEYDLKTLESMHDKLSVK